MSIRIEKIGKTNKGIPPERRVEIDVMLQVALGDRKPREDYDDALEFSLVIVSSPIEPPSSTASQHNRIPSPNPNPRKERLKKNNI